MASAARRTAGLAAWIALGLLVAYLGSGIRVVQADERGVRLRFGKIADGSLPPGIHLAWPKPIEEIVGVPVRRMQRISLDDFREGAGAGGAFRERTGLAPHLLTGDDNAVALGCAVQYSIREPAKYLFALAEPEETLRRLACGALAEGMAGMGIDEILTTGKPRLQEKAKEGLQRRLDEFGSGLEVAFLELVDVGPPAEVQAHFHDVVNARMDKDKAVDAALSYRNEKIPQAKAMADRQCREAEAFAQGAAERARGEAERFNRRLEEYRAVAGGGPDPPGWRRGRGSGCPAGAEIRAGSALRSAGRAEQKGLNGVRPRG